MALDTHESRARKHIIKELRLFKKNQHGKVRVMTAKL